MRRLNSNKKLPRCKKSNECSGCAKRRKEIPCVFWPVVKIDQPVLQRCNQCTVCKKKGSWKKHPCENPVTQKSSASAADKEIIVQSVISVPPQEGRTRSSSEKKKKWSAFEEYNKKVEKAKVKLLKTADVLEIPQIKKHAKYYSNHPSLMSSSTFHELKRLASISTQAIIETFSPFPNWWKLVKGNRSWMLHLSLMAPYWNPMQRVAILMSLTQFQQFCL